MRDIFMVTQAQHAKTQAAAQPELSPEQALHARFRLLQILQTSLNLPDLLALFFKHLQPLISVGGLKFSAPDSKELVNLGRDSVHHCDYRLSLEDGELGTIIFCRGKRFSEAELATLEQLLSYLVHPLRNAIKYQTALKLTLLDPLTLVGNRAAMDTALRRELQLAERHDSELALLLVDVDHFKRINDNYGHVRGDLVLQQVAQSIQTSCRSSDEVFRYGGEEFVVILSKTSVANAQIIAERIRTQVEQLRIGHNGQAIAPTISVGISGIDAGVRLPVKELFEQADQALYKAKSNGRNQVSVFSASA